MIDGMNTHNTKRETKFSCQQQTISDAAFHMLKVGPSTFFSAKQFEVFDIELLAVQDCQRRTIGFYSDVVCS
jgi:hypothetical protein